MKKICCVISDKYRTFKNPEISYIFEKALVLSISYSKCGNVDGTRFQEEESIGILKVPGLIKI